MMTEAQKPDNPPEEEVECEIHPPQFPWDSFAESNEEARRAFVAAQIADPEYDMAIQLQNMHALEQWIKTGVIMQLSKGRK